MNMEGYILILIGLLASQVGTFSDAEQDAVVLFNRQVEERKVMCLHFWYKMHGDSVGRLQVRILRGERYTHLWSKDGDQGDAWRQSWVTVNNTDNGDAPLLIEAMNSRNGSQISIESITVVSDPCPVPEKHNLFDCKNGESVPLAKLCDFINDCGNGHDELLCGTCNFEENQCGWNDSSSRNYQWQRDRNGTDTAGTGPATDHTLGTGLGYYMAAELSGEVHSNAVLEVELKESASSCEMHFWYHMWGSGFEGFFPGSLAVSVLGQSNKINMWEKGQDMGNQWNYEVLYLGRQKGPFKVQLVASHNIGSMEGDTAIDDIELKHCGLPEPQPFCSNTEFRCQREACVGLDRRCDFSDDCGDQTDEQGCELYMMCDFQDSWGIWQQETSKDTFSWERKSPTEIFFRPSNTGSNRDHTTNLKTGKYLYIDTTLPRKQGDTAWLLSPALYADEENACKMRLFYHMYGSSVGSLNIYTRRSTNESLTKQWMKSGEVGDYFVRLEVVLPAGNPFQVILEGVVGDGPNGFIVVDDISFTPGCHVFDGTSPNTTAIPTTPPPCPEGEVPCSDQCIFQDKVCDFYSDCADNSDEAHCGPCDFEHFACGWIDTSNGLYQWMLEMANISSNPGADHSIGTPYGHFMRVDGGSGGFFSKANLESPVLGPTGLACQMSFWYHLYTFFGVRSTSITLSLLNVTSGTAETLWSAPKKQNSDWVNVRLDIGNRPRGFKLLFSASASLSEQDIALDDIQFVGCSVKDHPPGTSHLSCDFEDGLCAWYQDKTDHFEWQRDNGDTAGISNHGPGYDHTTGNGYYMFIATESRQESAYKARLASYPQTPAKKRCVSFWYHIYGSNIGTLNFITKQEGKSEKVRWTRSATQGNKWNFADIHISETNTFVQFIFEAVPGGTQGSIAIDDVVITESINGSCPAERECTFETSRCNLKDVAGGSFNWTRITREISTNTSSPLEDHTLGTAYGFYLSTQIWKQASRNEGRIATRLYKPTPYSGECLQFWYYMKGENIGTFNIYLQKHRQLKALLWNRTGNQGDLWRHGRVTVQSPDSQYQIIFEGVAGTGHEGDIAIDDLLLLNGPCPPDGFCDFETGLCGWLNVVSEDDIDWTWNSGITPSSTHGPLVDHTTNSALGHYLFIKNNPMTGGRKIAHLLSEYMEPSATACLVFWYHMDMISFAEGTLTVYIKDYEGLRAIWNAKGDHGKIWLEAQVDYNSSSRYQIVIEGKHGHAMDAGSTSLDDIYIEKYLSCSDMALTTAIPTTVEPTQPASPQDCSFEQGLCNWKQETNGTFDWERQTGSAVLLPENGPLFDHTVGNIEGFYLIISSQCTANEAVISGPMISDATQLCLSFWFYMFGSSVSTLAVLVHTESHPDSVVWTRRGTQSASWINARVTIRMLDTHKIKFSGKTSSKTHGFIAIDDISVMEGECVSQGTCGFETLSVCNYEQDITADTDWVHTKGLGSGPPADHTYSTDKGYFMAVFGDDLVKRQTAQLLSPEYTPTTESCVRFWYWLAADSTSVFSVHVMQNKELGLDLWALSGNPSQDWDVAQVTVSSALHFRIVFKVQLDPAKGSFVALDDVTVAAGACPYTGSCDFEAHQCTWTNSQADDFDWIQANGHFSGPSVDHTTQTPEGMYMLAETQRHAPGQRAVFVSERFQRSVASCLTMWYFLSGRESGTLRIYFRSSATQDDLIFETSDSENTWKQFADNSFGPKGFQVVIEVESEGNGFVAVDDIDLVLGLCGDTAIPAIEDFASCDFEVGTCQWEDTSQGQFIWKRGSNGTASSNTGPSADHTTGTELGWYMAVEANDGDRYSYAVLQSPSMKQASSECLMEFYYHMYGTGIGELSVYLREGSRDTLLWTSSGSRANEWKRAVVGIGRTPGVFQLLLEATRTFSVLGDIAVDDIHFQNCYLREPQATCPEGTFKCSNSACIEMSRICDFSDDCGDRSDELDCELNGFKGRCSFENGLCSWENSDLDTPGYDWLRQQGQSAVWKTEPPRDHTKNSAAGFYVIAQGTNQKKGDTSLIQSSTLLPSTSCTVRFYYYIHGKDDGVLYVKLRSSASGGGDRILWVRDREVGSYWERAEISFSSPVKSKIVLEYTYGSGNGGQAAVDDISFSDQCVHDNENSILPPSPPPTAGPSTTPSPCQVDQFFCSKSESGYCIPASSKCDYSIECPMGEDEENCGPCTFENGQCGWNDLSSGRYVWQRQKAGHMAEPGLDGPNTDHTTGTGYYMYVEFGTGQFLDEALFISPHLPKSSPYCQIHFHFHMYGLEVGTLHMVVEKSSGSQTVVWSHWNSTGNHWNAEYANVGEMTEPYRILFISQPRLNLDNSASATDDIALDDISFRNCENSYQPPALPSYNCTFETDMCGWVQGVTDNFDWQRRSGPTETHNTGPTGDHTTGSGNYLYIESSNPRRVGDMAQLRSPLLAPTGPDGYCVTFWYHMFGATVGSLSMYLRRNMYESKTLVWQRQGTIEDEWQVAYRHVTLQDIHEIVFEATVGGAAGDISIDDISFTSGSCPPTDLCDFEENDCNWIQATDDDYDWARGFGRTPNSDTGPSFDHTTNTATGYYLYLKNSNQHRPGQIARISTPEYTAGSDRCLQFWYHMYGAGIGTLNVYKHDVSTANQSVLFSQQGNQGVLWRFAQASLYQSDTSPFQITFEGITGATVQGDMALDDILMSNGPCIPPGFCDFEINLCGWTNIEVVDEGDWLRSKGATPNMNTGPSVDHTTDSGQGYYIYVDHSQGYPGDRSMLVSEIFPSAVGGCCLTFWYHMYGQDIGTLTLYSNNRTLHESSNTYGDLIWSKSGNQGNAWLQGIATVDFLEPYWFIFVYIKGTGLSGDVAIDDIELHFESCSLPLPTTDVSTVPPTYAPAANDCDFEEDPCSWQQDPHNDFDWLRQRGSAGSGSIGPAGDHTTGSARGYYMYIDASSQVAGARARIQSASVSVASEDLCVKFWYYMYGGNVGSLKVYYHEAFKDTLTWIKKGTWGPQWNYAQIYITGNNNIEIIFEAVRENKWAGVIALDDISFNTGPCPSARDCDFENGQCGFSKDASSDLDWTLGSGLVTPSGPSTDHSYGTQYGHYMYFATSVTPPQTIKARLDSPVYPPSAHCLRFWYYMSGSGIPFLRVFLRRQNAFTHPVWSTEGHQDTEWHAAQMDINSPVAFQVTFEGIVNPEVRGDIAIDDISLLEGPCLPLGYCDFEDDTCTWKNALDYDQFDWKRHSGQTQSESTGPKVDHTLGTVFGTYLLMDASAHCVQGDRAWLLSPFIDSSIMQCVTFWYHMLGSDVGNLTVKQQWANTPAIDLWTKTGNQSDEWLPGFTLMSLEGKGKYRIIFEGVVGNGPVGTIAIDDIVIESGAYCLVEPSSSPSCQFQCGGAWGECVTLSQVCDFMIDCENGADEDFCGYDCTFEGDAGLCGWGDESHGPYQWQRGKGTTADANTGPTTDHTTLTSLGYYVYVDASMGSEGSYAVLRTPNLRQASATCQLIFWYHIYGSGIGTLQVAHLVGSRETRLWQISGSQGDLWHRAVVPLGRLVQDFHIAFEATRTFSVLGDIAIDDITFENCALPAYHIHCREGQFRCGRGSCVNTDRLCDFTDDCGDSTDERMCDAYPGRCDFEAGLCDWVQLNDELSWTVGRGGIEPTVAFGPDRDHTTGMSTGYFLFIDSRYPHQNGQHAKLGSPLLTSGPECQLRFYYYMSGDSVGAIRVYLRTSLGGPLELLWERQDKGGAYYERAEVSAFSRRPFQVIIEGSVGNEAGHVIAIDDASFTSDCWLYEGQLPSGSTLAPTTESPCSTNQFRCGHNECIPVSQYCDGVMNCIDGLDEATCGMCTFEERRCGWRDDSTGDHAWSHQQGLTATGTAPNADHTTGTAMGWYMLVDLSTGVFESEALLQSPVLGEAASSCTVSFWYHMPGFEGSSLSLFIVDKDEREIWSYTAQGENQWNQALARIGRQKFGYKLLFKAWTMPVAGDVALDDITMNNCYLPSPRPCMGGEFQCVRGSCVPDDSVCDFTDQCGDRSDENDCSTYERCDFEHDYCNMTHSEDLQTTWNRRNGLTNNVGPTFDHLGNRTAHYLSLSDQGGDHPSAGLRSIVFLPTNTGQTCQVKCYYHFGRLSGALNIGIRTHFDGDFREIWKQNVAQQEQWKRVVVTINSTEKFEVVIQGRIFAVDRPSETLAIDDISFSKGCVPASDAALSCPEGFGACNSQCIPNIKFCNFIHDCPPDRADEDSCPDVCDFESDQCGWNSEEPAEQISWQRMKAGDSAVDGTAPLKDHSLNSTEGHYIGVGVYNITYNTTTFLKSSIYHSSGLNCSFHFYYNIAGCSILSVWLHTAEEAQLLFKTHSATQNQWLGKEVKFPTCLQEFQIVFEGTIQSPTGFLALDSFKFSNCGVMEVPVCPVEMFACRTGSCIPNSSVCDYQVDCCDGADEEPQTCSNYTMCNFESNLCSWEQLSSDNANWIRQEGQPSTQLGIPHTDHTTGAHNGSFLYLTANTQTDPEVLAQLGSPVIQKHSLTSPICKVRFWYQLSEGAKLVIFTRTALGGDLRMTDDIINRTSNIWEKAEITIEPTAMETLIPFQIILQASVSLGNASVAIDDISITPACTTAEVLLPDTTTKHKDYGQIVFLTKNLPNQIGLAIDNSGKAFTANVTDNIASVFNLYSPGLYQNISETVSFKSALNESYYLQHSRNELGREVELFIKQIQSSNKDTAPASFWLAKNKWFPGFDALEAVSLPGYYIRHAGSRIFVAMDDGTGTFKEDASWKLRAAPPTPQCPPTFFPCDTGECIPAKKFCDFTADCPSGEDEADCAATCDFEANACGWYENVPGDGFDWRRSSQITVPPEYQSQAPPQDHSTNTTEGHFMFALKNSSRFSQIAEMRSPRFSQSASGCTMSFWHYNYGRAVGAADMDLRVEGENCSTTVIWRTLYNQGDQWLQAVIQLGRLTQPFHFSLTKVSLGVFDGVSALDDIYFENCSLPPPAASCEGRDKFHCRDTKACIGRLLVCDLVDDCGDGSDEDHCLMDLQCNFENGLCSWTQDTADSFDWTRIQGPTPTSKTGPWKDHTLGTVNGHYLYIEASDRNFQDTAVLLSQTFNSTILNDKKPCIFRFYYHMFGQHIYKLSVYKRSFTETKGELLWIKYGEQSNIWLRETLYLTSHQPFQILVEGTVGDDFNGDIGIDDLSFMDCVPYNGELPPTAPTTPSGTSNPITAHPHNCTVNQFVCRATGHCIDLMNRCDFRDDCSDKSDELTCVHPMCDFEGGNMHGWYQNIMTISSKVEHAFHWFTGQGSTLHPGEKNHRPTTDHTLGTPQGWYMYADSSNGEFGQIADLLTPVISQTGPHCKLVFWYHMNGVTVGSLQVFSKFGNVTHEVWSQSGSQGNKWTRGEVILGIRYNFEIILRAKRGVSYIGDVVVDDISFENCAPLLIPDRQCTANEFACANKYCIPKDSLCDFKNDCGDASDENPFICRTFQGRCDFEFDFCSWRQWHNDDFDWLLKAGSTPTIGSGPPTDHTLRETSGHYIYIKSTLPQAPGNKARISGPTISKNSKECKIIFYFHMAGNGIGTLNVYQVTISDQYLLLLNLTGDQGNYWQREELLLHAEEDFVVMFEGQAGKGVKPLISVDDILFTRECLLASSSGPTEPTSLPPSGSCPHGYLECQNGKCYRPEQSCDFVNDCEDNTDEKECGTSCNFEGGRCGWRNSLADNFDWILGEGSTKSLRPPIDHTLGNENGHFVYLEASSDGLKGDTSHMKSSKWKESRATCKLAFWYYFSATATGLIRLLVKTERGLTELWNMTGNQGGQWNRAEVPLRKMRNFEVIFEGIRAKDFGGGAAIDDIEFVNCVPSGELPGSCPAVTDYVCRNGKCIESHLICDSKPDCEDESDETDCSDILSIPGACNFNMAETESWEAQCLLEQNMNDDFDWSIGRGSVAEGTGPSRDHSKDGKGRYIYINSGAQIEGDIAILTTRLSYPASLGVCRVRFWYHMYGSRHMGTLKVYTVGESGISLLMWYVNGYQGNTWNYANVIVSNHSPFRVAFAAEVGGDSLTDIAMDDISFTPECEVGGPITPQPPTCSPDSFQCQYVYECIPLTWLCDWEPDCVDESDESNCPTKNPGTLPPQDLCRDGQFQCSNDQCLPSLLRCDGVADCPSAEDEFSCPCKLCLNGSLLCEDTGRCMPASQRCNGIVDCNQFQPDESSCTECPSEYCMNGGTCFINMEGPMCQCEQGWRGNRCNLKEKPIPTPTSTPYHENNGSVGIFAGLGAGLILLVTGIAAVLLFVYRRKMLPQKPTEVGYGIMENPVYGGFEGKSEFSMSDAVPGVNVSVYPWLEERQEEPGNKTRTAHSFANPLYVSSAGDVKPTA